MQHSANPAYRTSVEPELLWKICRTQISVLERRKFPKKKCKTYLKEKT